MTWQIAATGGSGNVTTVPLQTTNHATYGSPQIQTYKCTKTTDTSVIPIPTQDSTSTIGLDILGTTRSIVIEGVVVGTLAQLNAFILIVEGKLYGKQFTNTNKGCTLTVELARTGTTTYNVILKSFTYEWEAGVPGKLSYTLEMLEVSTT